MEVAMVVSTLMGIAVAPLDKQVSIIILIDKESKPERIYRLCLPLLILINRCKVLAVGINKSTLTLLRKVRSLLLLTPNILVVVLINIRNY
jgi:hypothetical protein